MCVHVWESDVCYLLKCPNTVNSPQVEEKPECDLDQVVFTEGLLTKP